MQATPGHPPNGHTTFYRFFSTGFFIGIMLAAFFVAQESGTEWIASEPLTSELQADAHIRISPTNAELQALLSNVENNRLTVETGTKHKIEMSRSARTKGQNRLPASAL